MKQKTSLVSREEIDFAPGENTWGLRVFRETWLTEDKKEKVYWKYSLPDTIMVAALTTEKQIIAIEEFQPGVGTTYLHLVGGTPEQGESSIETAGRELQEETGYCAEEIKLLTTVAHDSGKSDRKVLLYLATGCRKIGECEPGITVNLMAPLDFWRRLINYFMENPDKMHGGSNSLKAAALALSKLGYL